MRPSVASRNVSRLEFLVLFRVLRIYGAVPGFDGFPEREDSREIASAFDLRKFSEVGTIANGAYTAATHTTRCSVYLILSQLRQKMAAKREQR